MAQFTTDGMDDFLAQLGALGERATGIGKKACYDGMAVMADAVQASTGQLPLDTYPFTPVSDPLRVITEQDRRDLADCLGISRIETDGGVITVSLSFDGYISRTEPRFPNGVPAALIARSLESGSSVRAKNPFIRSAVNRAREAVAQAMQASVDASIEQINNMEG